MKKRRCLLRCHKCGSLDVTVVTYTRHTVSHAIITDDTYELIWRDSFDAGIKGVYCESCGNSGEYIQPWLEVKGDEISLKVRNYQ